MYHVSYDTTSIFNFIVSIIVFAWLFPGETVYLLEVLLKKEVSELKCQLFPFLARPTNSSSAKCCQIQIDS